MNTKIEWTKGGKTWNPIKARLKVNVTVGKIGHFRIIPAGKVGYHCEHISEGCRFCYAESGNCRTLPAWGTGLDYTVPNRELVDIFLDRKVLTEPMTWRKPCFCFPCSMTDLFADFVPDEFIDRIFAVMALTPHITYQVLTKRARRMREYLTENHGHEARRRVQDVLAPTGNRTSPEAAKLFDNWPLKNLWLGVSVENQPTADERIPELLRTPAALRFVSYEPALKNIDLENFLGHCVECDYGTPYPCDDCGALGRLDWGIVGGESGPQARPFNLEWAQSTIRQFKAAGTPLFVKQLGARPVSRDETDLVNLGGGKNGDWKTWPSDLQVREFPNAVQRP